MDVGIPVHLLVALLYRTLQTLMRKLRWRQVAIGDIPNLAQSTPFDEPTLVWRDVGPTDLVAIDEVADQIHVGLPERPEVFVEKFRLFPKGCRVLTSDNLVAGYGISHPWTLDSIPPLDTFLRGLPPSPNCIYIHDVVVLPRFRRRGSTGQYVQHVSRIARELGVRTLALVSVYDTQDLWARHGFSIVTKAALASKLASYGSTAKYMVKQLD